MGCASSNVADRPWRERNCKKVQKYIKEGGIDRAQLIRENSGRLLDFYIMEKKPLGEGAFGSVRRAKHKDTSVVHAIKTIPTSHVRNIERFRQEIAFMKLLDHPNIVKLHETFEDNRNIYLVMELCRGGELFSRIIEAGRFTECQAATVMQQITRGVHYMHANEICHRDLKPENFLLMSKDSIENSTLKIIDFGLSCKFKPGQMLTTKAGTPYYIAPQVLAGKYDQLCDMWSCGVILYVLLCGYPPFYGKTDTELLSKVRLGKFSFKERDWQWVTEDAKNLVSLLLKMNPRDRYTAEQALNHDWIQNKAPKAPDLSLSQGFIDSLRVFCCQNKLKKMALHIIAGQLPEKQIKALRETFTSLDHNGDGLLTSLEMREGLGKAGFEDIPMDLQQILEDVDSDGSGVIDYSEFLAATMEKHLYLREDVCRSAFRLFDRNGDGQISRNELAKVLSSEESQETIDCTTENLISQVDTDGDGQINFEEFMKMMHGN